MRINVGTRNPVKLAAVRETADAVFGQSEVRPSEVESGVREMPLTDGEILDGAVGRARKAFQSSPCDLGVGLEGGVCRSRHGVLLKGWAAVFNGDRLFVGATPALPLPDGIAEDLAEGAELSHVIDKLEGRHDIRSREGAFGVLTRNRIDRKETFRLALLCALAPLYNSALYEKWRLRQSERTFKIGRNERTPGTHHR